MIRVLVVDDHPVVRAGLCGMLAAEPGVEVVGEASSAAGAAAAARAHQPDVVLMDLRMPDGDGVRATSLVLAERPQCRIVVLTTFDNEADILRAVEAGASGYLLKDASREELVRAIRAAADGGTALAPSVAAKLVARLRPASGAGGPAGPGGRVALSPREIEVLGMVGTGSTNAEIGRALFISEATVKTHLLRAFGKLGVSDRTAAVTAAIKRGILPPLG
jgi:DNA-binding NarL/FixJ family response regulator